MTWPGPSQGPLPGLETPTDIRNWLHRAAPLVAMIRAKRLGVESFTGEIEANREWAEALAALGLSLDVWKAINCGPHRPDDATWQRPMKGGGDVRGE